MKSVTNPIGFHAFAYVNGNPVRLVDPFGRMSQALELAAKAVAVGTAFGETSTAGGVLAGLLSSPVLGVVAAIGIGGFAAYLAYDSLTGSSDTSSKKNTQIQIQACEKPKDDDDDETVYYHYTNAERAESIKKSRVIKADSQNRVYITPFKYSPSATNNALFMGWDDANKGTHVVEIRFRYPVVLTPGTQFNELIHYGSIREPRHAYFTVKENTF